MIPFLKLPLAQTSYTVNPSITSIGKYTSPTVGGGTANNVAKDVEIQSSSEMAAVGPGVEGMLVRSWNNNPVYYNVLEEIGVFIKVCYLQSMSITDEVHNTSFDTF